jgi:DNA polymerase
MPWDENDIRRSWSYQVKRGGQWVTVEAYGGILTENLVQALARDLLVHAMFKCEAENIPVVLTAHDEIVGEPKINVASATLLNQIMCDRPPWAVEMQIPVAADCWLGSRYRK